MGVTEQTFYRWKRKFGGLMPSEVRKAIEIKRGLTPSLSKGFHHARADLGPKRAFMSTPVRNPIR